MSLEMLEIPLLNWNFDWISYWIYLFSGFITVDFWNGLLSGSQDSSCVTLVCAVFCYPEMIKTQGLGSTKIMFTTNHGKQFIAYECQDIHFARSF